MSNEASCILDVKDCQVLIDSQLHDCLLVKAPLLTGNEDEEKPHEAAEPEETAHDDDEEEEVLVDEDRLLVTLHLHVHQQHNSKEADHGHNVEQVGREVTIRSGHDAIDCEDNC